MTQSKTCDLPARNVPEALNELLKRELDCMRDTGVIIKVEKPTDVGHDLIYMVKPDKSPHIFLDQRNLNKWIRHPSTLLLVIKMYC